MASSSLYGNQNSGVEIVQFQWFIFYQSSSAPSTPTGGAWNFQTNVGVPPSGWTNSPPTSPANQIWVSIAFVSSLTPTTLSWSVPGLWFQQGTAGQVAVGTTSTLSAGSPATVANSGTPYNAILNFGIPQGIQGIQGPTGNTGPQGPTGSTGTAATVAVGTTTTLSSGSSATVANSGTSSAAVFNFGIPQGLQGIPGSAASIAVGTTTTLSPSSSATVSNSGSSNAAIFNFGIPQGTAGTAATIAVGTTTTLAPGLSATVTNSGTSGSATFNFGIPQGTAGTAATIAVGTTTTTAPGTSATVTNSGTSGAAVFNFSIPQGAGVPSGGTTGQFLYKNSSSNYDTSWDTLTFSQIGSTPTTLSGYGITDAINVSQKGVSNGVATLDNTGKVPTSQLPAAVLGAVQYQGSWNASTNTPTLTSSVGTQGYYYVVSTAGTTSINGINLWSVGDWIVFNGSVWQKVNGSSAEAFSAITVTGLTGYMYANGTSQVTASTTIPNAGLANSTISGVSLGSNLNTLTIGSGLSGTSYNGSTAVTIANTSPMVYPGAGIPNSTGSAWATSYGTNVANGVAVFDANKNLTVNCLFEGFNTQAASGSTITLLPSSVQNWLITGSGGQTIKLPDATTLPNGALFTFNNNQSSGTIVVQNNSGTTVCTIQSGGFIEVILQSNSIAAGTWDYHNFAPTNASWSTNTLSWSGSYTNGTWNGSVIGALYGGTGVAGTITGYVYANGTGAHTASTTIPTTALSGTITNTQLTNSSITINGTSTSLGGSINVGTVTSASVVSANGFAGTVANATTTPAITVSTTVTGLLKGNGTAISAATSGTDYAPATSGSAILYGNGSGGFSSVSIGSGVSFTGGTLSATGSGGTVTSVSGAGSVNGITLTGTVTSSGSLTLGGTLGSITNSQLTNNSITFGATAYALGSTVSNINGVSIGGGTF